MNKQQKALYNRVLAASKLDPLLELTKALYNEGMREESFNAHRMAGVFDLIPEPAVLNIWNYFRDLERGTIKQ